MPCFNPSQVQFTLHCKSIPNIQYFVSIPHRFNSHSLISFAVFFFIQWFQSLTGSIHTPVPKKTEQMVYWFQSLTGSIHTTLVVILCIRLSGVSIPHRFNSHIVFRIVYLLVLKCFNPSQVQFTRGTRTKVRDLYIRFNPSQVQFTRGKIKKGGTMNIKFQSLTGSIHTSRFAVKHLYNSRVSIPHRFNSHKTKVKL